MLSSELSTFYSQNLYADGYDQLAINLVQGNGYRFYPDTALTLMREPGYPIFLAALFLICGTSFAAVKLMHMAMALLVAWLITRIASRVSKERSVRLLAPALFLLH